MSVRKRGANLLGVLVPSLLVLTLIVAAVAAPAPTAPEGTMTWAAHVTLAPRWLDPAETESAITPFMLLYPLHDAVVKLMPGGMQPSLAESWTMSPNGLTYEFVLRQGVKFHNGDPVTAEDVRFSFERYKGGGARLLKSKVKEMQTPGDGPPPGGPHPGLGVLSRR
jgi:peptide/nickel transport system substrate-binding protein